MVQTTLPQTLNASIDNWINDLDNYSFEQLTAKPSPELWSMGQVYVHLVEVTQHFVEEAAVCAGSNDNAHEEASPTARLMFQNNELPDTLLKGPPSNALTQQPQSKEQIEQGLKRIKERLKEIEPLLAGSTCNGKARHPGLNYFSATECLHFAEMHLRHHLRQKKRIDAFLQGAHA